MRCKAFNIPTLRHSTILAYTKMADMARALRRQRRAAKKAGYARLFTLVEGSARCAIASPGKEILKRCIRAYPSIGKRRDGTLLKGFRAWVRNQHVQHHQFGLVLETKGSAFCPADSLSLLRLRLICISFLFSYCRHGLGLRHGAMLPSFPLGGLCSCSRRAHRTGIFRLVAQEEGTQRLLQIRG